MSQSDDAGIAARRGGLPARAKRHVAIRSRRRGVRPPCRHPSFVSRNTRRSGKCDAPLRLSEATRPDPEFERIEKTYFGRRFFDEDDCKGGASFEIVDLATSKEFDLICAMAVKLDGSGVMQSRARRVPYLIESEAHQREMNAMIAAYERRASDATSSPARPRAGTTTARSRLPHAR